MKVLNILKATLISSFVATTVFASSNVIAVVNGEKITKDEIEKNLQKMYKNNNISFDDLPAENKKTIVTMLVNDEIVYQDAKKSKFEKDPEFQAELEKFKKLLYIEMWKNKSTQKASDIVTVSDKEAKEFYDKNQDKLKTVDTVLARHILVKTEKEAKDLIKDLDKAKDKLETFKELAKNHSIGPTAKKEGNLGWIRKDSMVKEFSDAAFDLKKSEYTKEPVKTQYGYHVIFAENVKPAHTLDFQEAKTLIVQKLKNEKVLEEVKKQFDALKAKAKIEIK